ncbi:type III effector protein XopAT [Xanthomonas campestris pv. raphani 756C]|nr:type III effector protein XopAT [Xanthomonas campestris pv. raphani 756C]
MGSCFSKSSGVQRPPTTNSVNVGGDVEYPAVGSPLSSSHSSSSGFSNLPPRPSRKSMANRDSTCRLAGEVENTLFFGRAETQERLILWAHDCDHDAMMKSLENTPITVRQFLGGNGLYDPEEKYPELNQRFADHLRSNPNRASAVNEENRENFSDEKPDMSMAMCMMGDPEKLAGRSYWEVESQAALNETEVFSRKSKGAIRDGLINGVGV